MSHLNSKFRDLLVYGLGSIANSAMGFVLLPIYMKEFEPSDYGVINVFLLIITFASMFVSAGMMSAVHRLFFMVQNEERRRLLGTTVMWYLAALGIISLIVIPFRRQLSILFFKNDDFQVEFLLVLIIVALTLILDVPFNILRLERRALPYVSFSLARLISELSLKILFIVVLKQGIRGYFISSIISFSVVCPAIFTYTRKYYSLFFSIEHFRNLIKLGVPFIFTGFAIWSINSIDRLQINFLIGQSATGVYSAGMRFAQLFNIVFERPLMLLLPPIMLSDTSNSLDSWNRFSRLLNGLMFLGCLAASLVAVLSIEGISIITKYFGTKVEYLQAIKVIPILIFAYFIYALVIPANYLGLRIEKTSIFAYAGILATIVSVISNYVLIKLIGVTGASWATLLSYLIFVIMSYWLIRRYNKQPFAFGKNILQFTISFISLLLISRLRIDNAFLSISIKSVTILGIVFLVGWKITKILDHRLIRSLKSFILTQSQTK